MTQDPGPSAGVRVAGRLAGSLVPGNSCVDLYVHTLWALLKRPIGPYLVQTDRALCASVVSRSERLLDDNVLMPEARRELQEMLGYVGWVHTGLRAVSSGPLTAAWHARPLMAPRRAISPGPMPCCRGPR